MQPLLDVLAEGRRWGLLGPGPLEPQVDHALGFGLAAGLHTQREGTALDLGAGGGLPGLVLAFLTAPGVRWTLLDGRERSVGFLAEAVATLGLAARVTPLLGRAEETGRLSDHRGAYAVVTARGFASPAVTAECAAPFLRVGGRLIVSEPPESAGERWPGEPLERLGLQFTSVERLPQGSYAVLEQVRTCPLHYPRRTGVPAKRPLFRSDGDPDVSRETPGSP